MLRDTFDGLEDNDLFIWQNFLKLLFRCEFGVTYILGPVCIARNFSFCCAWHVTQVHKRDNNNSSNSGTRKKIVWRKNYKYVENQ